MVNPRSSGSLEVFNAISICVRKWKRFLIPKKNIRLCPLINIKSNLQHFRCVSLMLARRRTQRSFTWHFAEPKQKKYHKIPNERRRRKIPEKKKINNFYVKSTHVQREVGQKTLLPSSHHYSRFLGWKANGKNWISFFQLLFMRSRWDDDEKKKKLMPLFVKLLARAIKKNYEYLCNLIEFQCKLRARSLFESRGPIYKSLELSSTCKARRRVDGETEPLTVEMFMQKITDLSQFLIAGERSHSIPHPSTRRLSEGGWLSFLFSLFYRR